MLDIGGRNAVGKDTAADAIAKIWEDFQTPIPGVKRKPTDGHNVTDGVEMKYYNPPEEPCRSLRTMLQAANGNGTCAAWAELLTETIKAQGIAGASRVFVEPNRDVVPAAEGFLVKNWTFAQSIGTGPNGLRNSDAVGDDVPLMAVGDGYPHRPCIMPGPDFILNTTPVGDDIIVFKGPSIRTGANGRCESTKANDDIQVIHVGQGPPHYPAIIPGPNPPMASKVNRRTANGERFFSF